MTRAYSLLAALALLLPTQLAQAQSLYPKQEVVLRAQAVSADTNFLASPLAGGDGKSAVTFAVEVTVRGSAASLMLVIDPDGSGPASALTPVNLNEAGTDLEPGRRYPLSWTGFKGESYQLQMSEATTVDVTVVRLEGAISVAMKRGSSSGGGLSSVSTTGDALSGAGTSGSPLAVANDLENLVDNWAIDSSGNATNVDGIAQTGSVSLTGAGTSTQQGYKKRILTFTGGSGAPTTLTVDQSGAIVENTGATVTTYVSLPSSADVGTYYYVTQSDSTYGVHLTAPSGETIAYLAAVSSSGGYFESTEVRACLLVVKITSTAWRCFDVHGGWNVG